MATVIDSLLITLGLDARDFNEQQKKAVEGLRKFDQAQTRSNKEGQRQTKGLTESFEKATKALAALGAVALTLRGMSGFFVDTAKGNAALGRQAELLGMSAKELQAFGKAAETVGGSVEGFAGSLQSIEGGLAKWKAGMGGEGVVTALARLGVQAKDGSVNMLELSDALIRVKGQYGAQTALALAQQLGLDQGTFQLLMKGRSEISALVKQMQDKSRLDDKNIEKAQELQKKWASFQQTLEGLRNEIFGNTAPAFEKLLDLATKLIDAYTRFDSAAGGIPSTLISIGTAAAGLYGSLKVLGKLFGAATPAAVAAGAAEGAAAGGAAATGAAGAAGGATAGGSVLAGLAGLAAKASVAIGLATHTDDLNQGEDEALAKKRSGSDYIMKYMMSRGWSREQAAGIAANIMAESGGKANAIGDKGAAYGLGQWHVDRQENFRKVFNKDIKGSSMDDQLAFYDWELRNTEAAAGNALRGTKTAGEAAAVVSSKMERPAAAEAEMAKRAQIAQQMVGARATAPVTASAGTKVETNINSINVQTQATDANGIARDMHQALASNALINTGTYAAQ